MVRCDKLSSGVIASHLSFGFLGDKVPYSLRYDKRHQLTYRRCSRSELILALW